ncbi:endonuclease NucS [Methanogenium marinum]|uniref:Endonuclease NucS n=1 Tax=Methanogenium marinum TaxID=348610 RepID=A0A9Q4KTY2_9EURY|nr:endonuclease NucS domain-containing protein [Methanogenium marinum]MDE4907176.1 endonuclease NucS [Methanogenium marinum]
MPHNIKLWNIAQNGDLSEINQSTLDYEERLEDWIEKDISILSDEYLIIGRQVPTEFNTFIDLLCLDRNGDIVIIELKRNKTPRDTVAQVLDYASWVQDLSRDAIISMANDYMNEKDSLESAFRKKFEEELPDALNMSHTMLVVASKIDESTERIVKYLSDTHGIGINVVEFQYFQLNNSNEYVSRVFLIDPETASSNMERNKTLKRKRKLSMDELEEMADQKGLREIYDSLIEGLLPFFDKSRTTRSSIAFVGKKVIGDGKNVIFSLIPSSSTEMSGLVFQVYLKRLAILCNCDKEHIEQILPENRKDWAYNNSVDEMWTGFEGAFQSKEEVNRFVDGLQRLKNL